MTTHDALWFLIGVLTGGGLATWVCWEHIGSIREEVDFLRAFWANERTRLAEAYTGIVHPGSTANVQHGDTAGVLIKNTGSVPMEYTARPVPDAASPAADTH